MAPFGAVSLGNLAGVKPVTASRANQMEAYVTAHGGDIGIPAYGGLRTLAQQQQLLQWEQDSVAVGGQPYAVASPNANATHTTGDAFDVKVNIPMHGLSVDETYHAMAIFAASLGLKAGYFFHGGPPAPGSDPFHFENLDRSLVEAPLVGPPPTNPDGTLTYNGLAYDPLDSANPYNLSPTNPDGTLTYNGLPYDPADALNPYTAAGGLPPVVITGGAPGGFTLSVPAIAAVLAVAGIVFMLLRQRRDGP